MLKVSFPVPLPKLVPIKSNNKKYSVLERDLPSQGTQIFFPVIVEMFPVVAPCQITEPIGRVESTAFEKVSKSLLIYNTSFFGDLNKPFLKNLVSLKITFADLIKMFCFRYN